MRRLIPDNDPAKLLMHKDRDPDVKVSVGAPTEVLEHLLQNASEAAHEASYTVARLATDTANPKPTESVSRVVELFVAIVESVNAAAPRLAALGIPSEMIQRAGAAFREEHGGFARGYVADDGHPEH